MHAPTTHSYLLSRLAALACLVAAAALAGCATAPSTPKPRFEQIAVVPVASPTSTYTQNRVFAAPILPAVIAMSISNRSKTRTFEQHMATPLAQLGPRFTQMLVEELQAKGLPAHVLTAFPRDPDAPDDIPYAKLPTDHAVLHIWFSDVSMDSPRTESAYLPRVNVDGTFLPHRTADDAHRSWFSYFYGTDAARNSSTQEDWSIPSDARYRFASFDALIDRAADVEASWHDGMRLMARRIAARIADERRQQN